MNLPGDIEMRRLGLLLRRQSGQKESVHFANVDASLTDDLLRFWRQIFGGLDLEFDRPSGNTELFRSILDKGYSTRTQILRSGGIPFSISAIFCFRVKGFI